jgi:hypothetical protein
MGTGVGTLAWAERTRGRLSFGDRLGLLGSALVLQARLLPAQVRWQLGLPTAQGPSVDPATLRAPDSAAAKAAEELCREISEPYLVNHCLRTYLWGRILAAQDGIRFDDELFYVACLMHDAGLVKPYLADPPDVPCFAVRGAEVARRLAAKQGWTPARVHAVAEAIALHLNVDVPLAEGPEAHLLNGGAALDVTGIRYWRLDPRIILDVLSRLPRLDMKRRIWDAWKSEADAHADCRGRFLNRYLQFRYRVRSAPFAE